MDRLADAQVRDAVRDIEERQVIEVRALRAELRREQRSSLWAMLATGILGIALGIGMVALADEPAEDVSCGRLLDQATRALSVCEDSVIAEARELLRRNEER
jgi:hypothetical protein